MNKEKIEYKMLQISAETHTLLKEYCKDKGLIMGHFVGQIVKKYIETNKKK
jgi:hypothetical protein